MQRRKNWKGQKNKRLSALISLITRFLFLSQAPKHRKAPVECFLRRVRQ
uniref:Uncharacterized protein n=1 Tax=Siphoviridae sp. ctS1E53 TaxID=2826340 RepID=A0A8S5MEK6_9CAUD|nr:MAG TPA: hypothetical protein [Siphoviridae sp. ctS1E53]